MSLSPIYTDIKIPKALISFLKKGKFGSYFIICDSNTLNYCLTEVVTLGPLLKKANIIEIEPGEENKSSDIADYIWQTLAEGGADKKSLIINLGGGVVSDLGGFCASVYKRGIPFINLPTTLLAMADASVGGKTAINFANIKNLIGTITQPEAVFVNTSFLDTLPEVHLRSGFAEIIKIALIKDKAFFHAIADYRIMPGVINPNVIKRSIELKAGIVKKDPFEKGLRKILNFGHSAGHAVESLFLENGLPLLHGQAVAIGMAIESYLCLMMKRITKKEFDSIIDCLKINFFFPSLDISDKSDFFTYFKHDKKHSGSQYLLALLKGIGKCDPAVKVSHVQMQKALTYYNTILVNASSIQ
jgi:3-dehydroquinate synthase